MPSRPRWLSFTSTHLGQRAAVVHAAAGAYGRLLERAQAGERLARVPDAGATARRVRRGVDEAAGQGGDPREVAEEVQRGALGGEDRRERALDGADDVAAPATASPSVDLQSTTTAVSTCAKASVAHAVPASTPALAGDERRPRPCFAGVEQRRRDVAERPEILGERASDRVADDAGSRRRSSQHEAARGIVSSSLGKSDRV